MMTNGSAPSLQLLQQALLRERKAHRRAEELLEKSTRDSYLANEALREFFDSIRSIREEPLDFGALIKSFLTAVCRLSRWPVGHVYMPREGRSDELVSMQIWHVDEGYDITEFKSVSEALVFRSGDGLPGRVLETGRTAWIEDIQSDPNFPRHVQAEGRAQLRSGFAVSVKVYGKPVAVAEFFSTKNVANEAWLTALVEAIAAQIGTMLERKQAELEAQQMQVKLVDSSKMVALGQMAGGVAHEVNSPLAIIKSNAKLLQELLEEEPLDQATISRMAVTIEKTVDRIARIIEGLRSFSREGSRDPIQIVPAEQVVETTLALCREKFANHGVKLLVSEISRNCRIECKAVQVSQVLLNLLSNSFDAVSSLPEKWIRLEVEDQAQQVRFRVTDSGPGIPEEVRKKLFQPFFTTKGLGKGTGLGLSISRGIAEAHGGGIFMDEACENTSFVLHFPAVQVPKKGNEPGARG